FAGEKAKSTSWRSQVLDFARGGISIQTITSSPQGSDAHRPLPRRHQYLRAHSVDVADHVVVPEPEHLETARAEMRVAHLIPHRFRMLPAIHLNDQLRPKTDEVEDIAVERILPAEAQPLEPAAAQRLPEQVFRPGGVLAHGARTGAVAHRRLVAHRSPRLFPLRED